MTRIPHESSELASWFAQAKQADQALTPSALELGDLAARLATTPSLVAPSGSTFVGGSVAQVGLGLSAMALGGGIVLGLSREPAPVEPLAPNLSSVSAPTREMAAPPADLPGEQEPAPSVSSGLREASPSLGPGVLKQQKAAPPTWARVNEALTSGNMPRARAALEKLIASEDGVGKERAELALAELELGGPRAVRAEQSLRRLASHAQEPSVRRRAQALLAEQ